MSSEAANKPVSIIQGDRLCVKCSYNMRGQPVRKEEHYGLYLARCPECGTPAAVQEYPLLGRWPGRLRVFIALAYTAVCLLAVFILSMTLLGTSYAVTEVSNDAYGYTIAEEWSNYVNTEEASGGSPYSGHHREAQAVNRDDEGKIRPSNWMRVNTDWWQTATPRYGFLERAMIVAQSTPGLLIMMGLVLFILGALLAVLLITARRYALLIIGLIPIGITAASMYAGHEQIGPHNQWMYAQSIAESENLAGGFFVASLLWCIVGTLGLIFGRPLARLGVRALLPPPMRGALAELWFTDNKPLPNGTRAPRTLYPETNPPTPPATPGDCDQ